MQFRSQISVYLTVSTGVVVPCTKTAEDCKQHNKGKGKKAFPSSSVLQHHSVVPPVDAKRYDKRSSKQFNEFCQLDPPTSKWIMTELSFFVYEGIGTKSPEVIRL